MPELPDITAYIESMEERLVGTEVTGIRLTHPFLLRTVEPPAAEFIGLTVSRISRIGKRIVLTFPDELHMVLHLMVAGRLSWSDERAAVPRKTGLGAFDFTRGNLVLTEAGTRRRASLHLVRGEESLSAFDQGGLEILEADPASFAEVLRRENHTIKRSLTDPRILSGVGNSFSDEILHSARLSPMKLTAKLSDGEIERLYSACRSVLSEWIRRLRDERHGGFPKKVTAFKDGMAVHGRFGKPCPICGTAVQRIRYAENECDYCPVCQTEGRILSDRALSRLLKDEWPRTVAELEERFGRAGRTAPPTVE